MNNIEILSTNCKNNEIKKILFFNYYENEFYKLNISYMTVIDSNGIKEHFINFPYPVRGQSLISHSYEDDDRFLSFFNKYESYVFEFIHFLISIAPYEPDFHYGSRDKIWKEMWEAMKELKIVEMKNS